MDDFINPLITEEARAVKTYIKKTWPNFEVKLEIPLRELFPKPISKYYWSMWSKGSADVIVYYQGKIVVIFEPGGAHHFQDPKQIRRDKIKTKICQMNGVRCFRFANNLPDALSNRKKRQMFGRFLFGMKSKLS